ncbi:4-(cytidine 5'-diphospho)-2-C-methyl-D-erythritol kinase [Candidatus Neptunochlamydia vexilliferae]|uniref:4-diphosphocytidyl-2-C-methyl-D-erythritol kinase n=1 Tax=Candidatus Neptunichlamydia vexilliferae TaxID=1651774 RepID=A0ABS0AWR4_9BACT|nr:4-(cytidine 5'-diphospho)-2-C-methyl-D-erythritol kinase [Candidatus Neptunochlamydia vexilliferae]MBF5058578.1 4-diphosphocytidyl-2-C-methyl-D-erythritol kinase [Candidatus Neptunochlamydia vexilliferae]
MKLFSPAKLNLFFRVLKKRTDGFHEIASLMQAISFGDTLHFEVSDKDTFTCTDPSLPTDETNFVPRARTLFREKTSFIQPIAIHLEKKVPIEGGLGGGSSNIATTLWALNQLSGLHIDEGTLSSWAGELSSDAPFFFSWGTANVTGRGEKVEPLKPLPPQSLYLAKPKGGLSTPLVYKHCCPNDSKEGNDLEAAAFALRPDLGDLKRELLALGFETVTMTGSGTTFFCTGAVEQPTLPDVNFWKTSFLWRKEGNWYKS